MGIEWIVPNELYWNEATEGGRKGGVVYRVNPLGGRNISIAYVEVVLDYMDCAKEKYEAFLIRNQYNPNTYTKLEPWSLGVFDTVQEGKEAIITTLVLHRLGEI